MWDVDFGLTGLFIQNLSSLAFSLENLNTEFSGETLSFGQDGGA